MYSGTGVWAGQAHWQSTTRWKYSGLRISVGRTLPSPRVRSLPGWSESRPIAGPAREVVHGSGAAHRAARLRTPGFAGPGSGWRMEPRRSTMVPVRMDPNRRRWLVLGALLPLGLVARRVRAGADDDVAQGGGDIVPLRKD